ncbi:MAG: hypothetical protein UW98_C0002G0021, partial [Parcubacteria group bacterium GW2011_GWC2_45_15]
FFEIILVYEQNTRENIALLPGENIQIWQQKKAMFWL